MVDRVKGDHADVDVAGAEEGWNVDMYLYIYPAQDK